MFHLQIKFDCNWTLSNLNSYITVTQVKITLHDFSTHKHMKDPPPRIFARLVDTVLQLFIAWAIDTHFTNVNEEISTVELHSWQYLHRCTACRPIHAQLHSWQQKQMHIHTCPPTHRHIRYRVIPLLYCFSSKGLIKKEM